MGAAGLTCSTCEMGARGELGVTIELDRVPQRETGMSSYEIMLSESQERMLLVAEKGREQEVLDVFAKWGLDCAEVGIVTADDVMRVYHHGVLEAEIPNKALTDEAPVYHRPVGTWTAPVPKDPPTWVLEELHKPRDYTADLKRLLASANVCSKAWVYEQYDSMVQTNTVQGPGGEAGVMRVKGTVKQDRTSASQAEGQDRRPLVAAASEAVGQTASTERGIAMALAGNGRWCYLDPYMGAINAVTRAALKVACTGATPVAATNCLNFGNPQKPEIMAQLSGAIDGIAEACTALGTPITGGNVSLYNETLGEGIYPTPTIGVVGILNDVSRAVSSSFQREGDAVIVVDFSYYPEATRDFGSSEFAKVVLGTLWGTPPWIEMRFSVDLKDFLIEAVGKGNVKSCSLLGGGGLVVALAKAGMEFGIGVDASGLTLNHPEPLSLFAEGAVALMSCDPSKVGDLTTLAEQYGLTWFDLGRTTADRFQFRLVAQTDTPSPLLINSSISELRKIYGPSLETQVAEEVFA